MALTHWRKLDNPDYIGAYAFQPKEEKVVTVRTVKREIVTGAEGKKEECTVVYFEEPEKPMILNATNGKTITKRAGSPFIENWAGLRLVLGVEKVKAFGEVVDAVRVLDKNPPAQPKKAVPCADCGGNIEAVSGWSAEQIIKGSQKRFGVSLCMACASKRKEG